MAKRKYYSIILIILLISIMALAQESTTIDGIIANYTELNTSRIFRIYDTSLNEILLSEDGLYLSHVNGGINEIRVTSTSTQFSQQLDMNGNDIINCGNCDTPDNGKVNKSGDNITGLIKFYNYSATRAENITEWYWDGIHAVSHLDSRGIQKWYLNVSGSGNGRIEYSTPGGQRGIVFFDKNGSNRTEMKSTSLGLQLGSNNSATAPTKYVNILMPNSDLRIDNLSGTGNAYLCLDSTGTTYRGTPTC